MLGIFFLPLIFWAMIKWEEMADTPKETAGSFHFLTLGLSMGVHLLSLLAIPAMGMIYYFKITPTPVVVSGSLSRSTWAYWYLSCLECWTKFSLPLPLLLTEHWHRYGCWHGCFFTLILAGLVFYGVRYAIQKIKEHFT